MEVIRVDEQHIGKYEDAGRICMRTLNSSEGKHSYAFLHFCSLTSADSDLSYWRDVIEVITFAFIASYLGRADDRKAALDWLWKDRSSTLDELISAGDEKAMSSGAAAWLKCISAECYTTTIDGKVTYVVVDSADFIESVFSSAMKDSDLQDEMKAAARHAKEGLDTTAE